MNSKLKYIFTVVCISLIVPAAAFATEKNPKGGEGTQPAQEAREDSLGTTYSDDLKSNEPFILEDQVKHTQELIVPQKPVTSTTTAQSEKPEPQQNDDTNSAMSFNFIYYIIDKFKLADPMD